MDVVGLYMVSAIDRINYAEVGFYLDDVRTKAAQTTYTDIVDNREETKIVTVSGSVAFSNVSITKKDTTTDVYTASSLVPADKYGYMLCYGVSKESKWQTAGESFTLFPGLLLVFVVVLFHFIGVKARNYGTAQNNFTACIAQSL